MYIQSMTGLSFPSLLRVIRAGQRSERSSFKDRRRMTGTIFWLESFTSNWRSLRIFLQNAPSLGLYAATCTQLRGNNEGSPFPHLDLACWETLAYSNWHHYQCRSQILKKRLTAPRSYQEAHGSWAMWCTEQEVALHERWQMHQTVNSSLKKLKQVTMDTLFIAEGNLKMVDALLRLQSQDATR